MGSAEANTRAPPVEGGPEVSTALQLRVFDGFALSTAIFSFVMIGLELALRGPWALQTWAFVLMSSVFFGLRLLVRRTRRTKLPTVFAISVYFSLFCLLERMNPATSEGIRVAFFAFPIAVMFLAGFRWALLFWAFASLDTALVVRVVEGDRLASGMAVLNAFGAVFVGAILLTIVWSFDRERRRAEALAHQREQGLREAVAQAERAQAEAEEAAAARTYFLANMSHEIRTPMNGVLGLSRLLVDETEDPGQRRLAETILSSGESLLHILDDILDLSKLDAGALDVDPTATDPSRLAGEVVRLMAGRATEAGLHLALEIAPEVPPWVLVDGHRVRQVLSNLVGNGLKFTPSGEVRVRMSHRDGCLEIAVQDTGIGMNEATLGRLFSPFSQADAGTARRFGGTGLGLAICKHLCELMGGAIGVASEVGRGSRFWFRIPAPVCEAPKSSGSIEADPTRPLRVLVAEDTPVNQLVARRFLERLGAEVTIVSDGGLAAERAAEEAFDVVLMDLQMPEVDGIEATRRIRAIEGPRGRVPIVALTASVMAAQRAECFAAGMNDVLGKPLDFDQLRAKLAELE